MRRVWLVTLPSRSTSGSGQTSGGRTTGRCRSTRSSTRGSGPATPSAGPSMTAPGSVPAPGTTSNSTTPTTSTSSPFRSSTGSAASGASTGACSGGWPASTSPVPGGNDLRILRRCANRQSRGGDGLRAAVSARPARLLAARPGIRVGTHRVGEIMATRQEQHHERSRLATARAGAR